MSINNIENQESSTLLYYSSDIDFSYLNFVQESELPINVSGIKKETSKDRILSKILFYVKNGWPSNCPDIALKAFFERKCEITVEQNCLMWGYRLIIPQKYKHYVLSELHSTHMGLLK